MKNTIILTCLILLFSLTAFGQQEKYKTISNSELELYVNLISILKDTSFVTSPLVEESTGASMLSVSRLIKKCGFNRSQFRNSSKDTFIIRMNRYFEVISPDSMSKFNHLGLKMMKIDSTIIFNPYYYFIEKTYHKECICKFSKTIFTKKRIYAIAKYYIECGPKAARGETILMKKTKNRWKIIDRLSFDGS
jgi:hypothetical protein